MNNTPNTDKSMTTKKKRSNPNGNSRAAQNKKIRRDALREELKARNYLKQLSEIEQRLDPEHDDTYCHDDLPKIKERTGILFKLLDKCLPNLRPIDIPVTLEVNNDLATTGEEIINSMMAGIISPQEASSLMQVLTGQLRVIETDDLTKRLERIEETL